MGNRAKKINFSLISGNLKHVRIFASAMKKGPQDTQPNQYS